MISRTWQKTLTKANRRSISTFSRCASRWEGIVSAKRSRRAPVWTTMGKGGCRSVPAADLTGTAPEVRNDGMLKTGWTSLMQAIQIVTSNKWAEEKLEVNTTAESRQCPVSRLSDGRIPWDTIRLHDSASSCWIVVRGKVYDVTNFAPLHPGGSAIVAFAGRDATDAFAAFHQSDTWSKLKNFYIGEAQASEPNEMLSNFRKLRAEMTRAGLFRSSKSFYAWKLLSLLSMFITAAAILMHGNDTWLPCFGATCVLALAWQQSGWMAHDFLHHQVFNNRALNNCVGLLVGSVLQGFSVDWWKNKHNKHHAVPNECTEDAHAVDPDIDTLPLLAWSEEMLQHVPSQAVPLIRHQHIMFFPILCFARLVWAQQSFLHARMLSRHSRAGRLEVCLILAHYTWLLTLALSTLSVLKAVLFVLGAQILAGFMLALVFVQSHNAMEVYSEAKDFVSAQIHTTRNIDSSPWMDWFSGGLNYQIEHHLFPTLPRHNLGKVKQLVVRFCEENGFAYESCGMDAGTYRVLQRLASVAAKVTA